MSPFLTESVAWKRPEHMPHCHIHQGNQTRLVAENCPWLYSKQNAICEMPPSSLVLMYSMKVCPDVFPIVLFINIVGFTLNYQRVFLCLSCKLSQNMSSFLFKIFFYVYVCVCVCVSAEGRRGHWTPSPTNTHSRAGGTGDCEPCNIGTVN